MSGTQVNGNVPKSSFLKHLTDYPVVHDSFETFKSNPYGAKSIQLGDSAYQTFAAPVLPYLYKPYQYVEPYVKKADDLGNLALDKVDERFPVVKKPTNEIFTDAKGIVLFPLHKGFEGKDHVFSVYSSEYKKANGDNGNAFGLIPAGKATVATALVITGETVRFIGDFLSAKKEQTQNAVDNKVNN
ncbi:Perilipin-2 [Cytospora mali]|uniref:Perilipin-2 n=1 Tax=Cytospora mali TaxID=578113 RepID=A0A194UNR1_CYTMA|nr:Perilipin-2 [Valsa mali var. pyri (nom. inval.)]